MLAWGISASEGLEHERPESVGACHAAHHLLADTREKGEDGNVVVVVVVHVQSFLAHSAVAAAQDVVTGNVVAAFGIKDFGCCSQCVCQPPQGVRSCRSGKR